MHPTDDDKDATDNRDRDDQEQLLSADFSEAEFAVARARDRDRCMAVGTAHISPRRRARDVNGLLAQRTADVDWHGVGSLMR
jgi:hypothetical protein